MVYLASFFLFICIELLTMLLLDCIDASLDRGVFLRGQITTNEWVQLHQHCTVWLVSLHWRMLMYSVLEDRGSPCRRLCCDFLVFFCAVSLLGKRLLFKIGSMFGYYCLLTMNVFNLVNDRLKMLFEFIWLIMFLLREVCRLFFYHFGLA